MVEVSPPPSLLTHHLSGGCPPPQALASPAVLWEAAGRGGRAAVAVGVTVLMASHVSLHQCGGLMTEEDGGPVPSPALPRFLACWEDE